MFQGVSKYLPSVPAFCVKPMNSIRNAGVEVAQECHKGCRNNFAAWKAEELKALKQD